MIEIYKIRTDGNECTEIRSAEAYSGDDFMLFGNSIFYTATQGASPGDKYNTTNLYRLSINGDSLESVYNNRGSESLTGYFVDKNKLHLVVR
jgi:hypothetical protein